MAEETLDIAVVGAGAAGLMAALFARRVAGTARVVALDGARKIGAKILISGGGRCNVTHFEVTAGDFNGSSRNQIAKVLRTFSIPETVAFFEELGVSLKREETGKLFPVDDRARSVLDALMRSSGQAGVEIRAGCRVESIEKESGTFLIYTSAGPIRSRLLVLASGGKSVPETGSDGHGYSIVRQLGHSIVPPIPALVPLLLPQGHPLTRLSGVSTRSVLSLRSVNGKVLTRHEGSLLFTHFGLSGPVALDMSRHWIAASRGGKPVTLTANFDAGREFDEIDQKMVRDSRIRPRMSLGSWTGGLINERLASLVLEQAGVNAETMLGQTTKESRRAVVRALTGFPLPVSGDRGFRYAEATAGGVPLSELHLATMESRIYPGLYLAGEILDVDGRIGGFNFQWAWASGRLAGMSAGARLTADSLCTMSSITILKGPA